MNIKTKTFKQVKIAIPNKPKEICFLIDIRIKELFSDIIQYINMLKNRINSTVMIKGSFYIL